MARKSASDGAADEPCNVISEDLVAILRIEMARLPILGLHQMLHVVSNPCREPFKKLLRLALKSWERPLQYFIVPNHTILILQTFKLLLGDVQFKNSDAPVYSIGLILRPPLPFFKRFQSAGLVNV